MTKLKKTNNKIKIRFFCWLIITTLFLACFFKILITGFSINSNILDLLPQNKQNPVVSNASDSFSKMMGKQLIFLIGNPSQSQAQKAADQFFNTIKNTPLLQKTHYLVTENEQNAWGTLYFPHRLSLLTSSQKKLLQENKIFQIQQSALFSLYSPFGIKNSDFFENDPFFLFQNYIMSLPKPASNLSLHNQRMMVHHNQNWYVMLTAQLKNDSFSISNQNKALHFIQTSKQSVLNNFPHTNILMNGMLFYAKSGADEAQHDISTIGIGSLIGIVLLMLLTFRSLSPLIFTLISSAVGFVSAFVLTYYFFGTLYLFTLVLGASLIGICVDYAFFYYSEQLLGDQKWTSMQGLKNIFPGISFGLLNLVLAYAVLSFTPFPGLQQLSVFSITGLTMAYATVVCVFPLLLKAKKHSFDPPLLKLTRFYLKLWEKISLKKTMLLFFFITIFSTCGIYQLRTNDDIRLLESIPLHLKNNEHKIKKIIGNNIGMNFYVVEGETPDQTLAHEKALIDKIDQSFQSITNKYIAISSYLPHLSEQKENFELVKKKLLDENLTTYLEKIGVNKQKAIQIKQNLYHSKFKPLTLDNWRNSPSSASLRFLWLGKVNDKFVSIVLLSDQLNPNALEKITKDLGFATYINKANEISLLFKTYRINISQLLIASYFVLFLFLIIRYSARKAVFYFLPPIAASTISLATLGWLNIPLTLFNVLAITLILGISVDYVLFLAETKSKYSSTMLAVTLSTITMILSFGLLALSSTPVIHYFGITVSIGIIIAFLLSPIVIKVRLLEKRKL